MSRLIRGSVRSPAAVVRQDPVGAGTIDDSARGRDGHRGRHARDRERKLTSPLRSDGGGRGSPVRALTLRPKDDPQFTFPARSSSRIHATTASPEKIRTLMIPGMHREEAIAALRSHFPAHPPRLRRTTHCPAWVYGARRGPRGALGRRVDLVTPDALKPRMRPIVGCTTVDVGGTTVMSRKAELERSRRVVREGRDWTGPSKKGAHEEGPY